MNNNYVVYMHYCDNKPFYIGIGRNELFALLRDKKILMKNNLPYQKYINSNLFVVKNTVRGMKVYSQTYVTTKGQVYINKIVK